MAVRPILVVEDDDDGREGLLGVLRTAGYPALGARTAIEALTTLRERQVRPSLILLDLFLPGMSGWEFREAQCGEPDLAAIPVILVSAFPHTMDTIQRGRLRAAEAFRKPVDPSVLLAVVEQHLGPPLDA